MVEPLILPDFRTGDAPLTLTAWLVEVGEEIDVGDGLLEVGIPGITWVWPAPVSGRLTSQIPPGSTLVPGQQVGTVEGVVPS